MLHLLLLLLLLLHTAAAVVVAAVVELPAVPVEAAVVAWMAVIPEAQVAQDRHQQPDLVVLEAAAIPTVAVAVLVGA